MLSGYFQRVFLIAFCFQNVTSIRHFIRFCIYMKILVINAGSSSLKYQLFDMQTMAIIAK